MSASPQTLDIEIPAKLVSVFTGKARYRGAYGGRGSGKTRSFAKVAAVRGAILAAAGKRGIILCGREYMNSLDESSMAEVKEAILSEPWLEARYDVGEKLIRTKDRRIEFKFAGLRQNIDSIKSKARIHILWVDEAEPVSEEAWRKIVPTVREQDSEIWVTWNPERKNSATHQRFRVAPPESSEIVELNWRDNPWFPEVLEMERREDFAKRPEQYAHVWEGDFATVHDGAYFAHLLSQARKEGRIGKVAADPLMEKRAYWDIGGTGLRADARAIWIVQFHGKEIRVLDYRETAGQPLSADVEWLRAEGYKGIACVLPHDGETNDRVHDVSYESYLRAAGFPVVVIPNQGRGAAGKRIEAVRRLLPSCWFNEPKTEAGVDALGWYHEKRDDERNIGLGPEHDWSSHGCFHGETKVLTRYGMQRIMDLPDNGEVLTPCGWKQYVLPRITKRNARLVEVEFTSGYSVKCTPDHLFLTASGWKSAESLTPSTVIRSTLTRSRNTSTAGSTGFGRAKAICRAAASGFTETFGRAHSGLSRAGVTSTTVTAMSSTTGLKTSNAFRRASISPTLAQSGLSLKLAGSQPTHGQRLPTGTSRQRDGFGTSATRNARKAGQSGSGKRSRATTAASRIKLSFAVVATRASSVARRARWLLTASADRQTSMPAVIANVRRLKETADVWDITVPDGHWFSLENGAVVHNSDAFGLMCVAYEQHSAAKAKPIKFKARAVI